MSLDGSQAFLSCQGWDLQHWESSCSLVLEDWMFQGNTTYHVDQTSRLHFESKTISQHPSILCLHLWRFGSWEGIEGIESQRISLQSDWSDLSCWHHEEWTLLCLLLQTRKLQVVQVWQHQCHCGWSEFSRKRQFKLTFCVMSMMFTRSDQMSRSDLMFQDLMW